MKFFGPVTHTHGDIVSFRLRSLTQDKYWKPGLNKAENYRTKEELKVEEETFWNLNGFGQGSSYSTIPSWAQNFLGYTAPWSFGQVRPGFHGWWDVRDALTDSGSGYCILGSFLAFGRGRNADRGARLEYAIPECLLWNDAKVRLFFSTRLMAGYTQTSSDEKEEYKLIYDRASKFYGMPIIDLEEAMTLESSVPNYVVTPEMMQGANVI